MSPVLQAIMNKAKEKHPNHQWFDGDEFIKRHFHDDCARHLLTLVERGFLESEGFYLRVSDKRAKK